MICFACGKEYEGSACSRCQFPSFETLTEMTEADYRAMEPVAMMHRKRYLASVRIGVRTFHWRDVDGRLVSDQTPYVFFADGVTLLTEKEQWCDGYFARIPDQEQLNLTIVVEKDGQAHPVTVALRNLLQPELQQVGVRYVGKMDICVVLKNESAVSVSEALSLPDLIGGQT